MVCIGSDERVPKTGDRLGSQTILESAKSIDPPSLVSGLQELSMQILTTTVQNFKPYYSDEYCGRLTTSCPCRAQYSKTLNKSSSRSGIMTKKASSNFCSRRSPSRPSGYSPTATKIRISCSTTIGTQISPMRVFLYQISRSTFCSHGIPWQASPQILGYH